MEWWKLWVPFGGTIIGIIVNVWINVSQNKKNQSFQEKMKQKEIDANLKAKARIEWITEVRYLVSKYLSYLFDIKILVSRMHDIEEELSNLEKEKNQKKIILIGKKS